ncbi:MAG: TetR/AcrR family transcriptional regulator [Jatrophihabitantaceae bacterium]
MSPSLREERKIDTSARIAAAALGLFAARGYAAVTISEVAAAARVGERTVYRYYDDKEDLLFGEDEGWRAELQSAIEQQPDGQAPFTVLRGASAAVARAFEDRREDVARRAKVIAESPALTARERAKHAAWEVILEHGLCQRGVAPGQAALLGRIAIACYNEAQTRWLAHDEPRRTLDLELEAAFNQLAALVVNAD